MSCDTLSQSFVSLNVTMGALPEGFCPSNMQDLANAIAARLIVTPNQSFSTFAIGSLEPSSNIGPWLKNCLEWFVFDDATGRYVPIKKSGFDNQRYYSNSDTFVVPDFITTIRVTAFGGGGGGYSAGSIAAGAGGGGAFGMAIRTVVPGQAIPLVVGTGGSAGTPGNNGGDTTILGLTAGGGKGATGGAVGGLGGAPSGFDVGFNGQAGDANSSGGAAVVGCAGGDAGGWGGKGGVINDNNSVAGRDGTAPGGGGVGSANATVNTAGNGAAGGVLIEW